MDCSHVYYVYTVGAEISQTNTSELKFLFEGHEDFSTIPSYAVLPAMVRTLVLSPSIHAKMDVV